MQISGARKYECAEVLQYLHNTVGILCLLFMPIKIVNVTRVLL